MQNLSALIALGGPIMALILAMSVLLLAMILLKLAQFTRNRYWMASASTHADWLRAGAGLRLIETIANTAPLLGLLGTVLGMISAFRALEAAGESAGVAELAGGIWQALATSAAGMIVSIIATIALGIFDGVVERLGEMSRGGE